MSLCSILLTASCDALIPQETTPELVAPRPVEINIGPYPSLPEAASAGQPGSPGTRTNIDPTNNLKTTWAKGDMLWIRMHYNDSSGQVHFLYGYAGYNGYTWNTDLYWPVEATGAGFNAIYTGEHKPGDGAWLWDTDVLWADANIISPGEAANFNSFEHQTHRITLTGTSLTGLYLAGNGFRKIQATNEYELNAAPLGDGEYIPLSGTSTTVYLGFYPGGTRQLYKSDDGQTYTLVGNLNFSDVGSGYSYGRAYTLDLDTEGAITPGGMNEEQKRAQDRAPFLAWVEKCHAGTYEDFTLTTDIDLTGIEWMPVDFHSYCIFNGNGHTISGLKVTQGNGYNQAGLFGEIDGATVKNLHVSGTINVPGNDYTGGIAGHVSSSAILENVSFTGSVTGGTFTGGIAGTVGDGYLFACQYQGDSGVDISGDFGTSPSAYIIGCHAGNVPPTADEVNTLNQDIATYNAAAGAYNPCNWHWELIDGAGVVKEGAP